MWSLHNVAAAYGCRPSDILTVQDDWLAYQLDRAVLTLARWVEGKVADGGDVAELLAAPEGLGLETGPSKGRAWADPRGLMGLIGKR